VDKRAPGKIQEYVVEKGLSAASNSSPQTVCWTAPFFSSQTHKNQNSVLVCRETAIPGRWLVWPTVRTKGYHEAATSSPLQSHGNHTAATHQILGIPAVSALEDDRML